jgi:hypothetical protein
MLNFYINRAGENLPAKQERILEQAKVELRKLFAKDRAKPQGSSRALKKGRITASTPYVYGHLQSRAQRKRSPQSLFQSSVIANTLRYFTQASRTF